MIAYFSATFPWAFKRASNVVLATSLFVSVSCWYVFIKISSSRVRVSPSGPTLEGSHGQNSGFLSNISPSPVRSHVPFALKVRHISLIYRSAIGLNSLSKSDNALWEMPNCSANSPCFKASSVRRIFSRFPIPSIHLLSYHIEKKVKYFNNLRKNT